MIQMRYFLLFFLINRGVIGAEISLPVQDKALISSLLASLSHMVASAHNYFAGPSEPKIQARLAINNELSGQEVQFLHKRLGHVKGALQKLLGREIPFQAVPRIGFCFSGGGVRALVSTMGFLKKAEERGLFDACLYTSALSGSTWALAPWFASKDSSIASYYQTLAGKLENGLVFTNPDFILNMSKKWVEWFDSGRIPSAIDLYGDLLANILLTDHNDQKFDVTLSKSHAPDRFEVGEFPLPLYTAIMPKTEPYTWFEFSPFECGSQVSHCYIPPYALGAQFENGISSGKLYEPSLGYMMGIFGSAFDVSMEDLFRIYAGQIDQTLDPVPDRIQSIIESAFEHAYSSSIGDLRFLPAKLPNYSHDFGEHGLSSFKRLTFVDAGIDCNIPVVPLLHPERALDMLIILDVSADNEQFQTLKIARDYALAHRMPFPEIDYVQLKEQSYAILRDDNDPKTPVIVYIALAKEEAYNPDFDPIECAKHGFCSTFNFKYTSDEIDLLAGLAGYRLEKLCNPILEQLAHIVEKKQTVFHISPAIAEA